MESDLAFHLREIFDTEGIELELLRTDSRQEIWFTEIEDKNSLARGIYLNIDNSIPNERCFTPFIEVHTFPPLCVGTSPFQMLLPFSDIEHKVTGTTRVETFDLTNGWESSFAKSLSIAKSGFRLFKEVLLSDERARYALDLFLRSKAIERSILERFKSDYSYERIINELEGHRESQGWKEWFERLAQA